MGDLMAQLDEGGSQAAEKRSFPEWIEPMLAKLTEDYFSKDDWIYERKLDGERVFAYVKPDGEVHLYSRNQNELNDNYPEIEHALESQAPKGCVLDGEVVAFNENDVTDFQRLQPRMQSDSRQGAQESDVAVYYYLFDCPYADGHDLTNCALSQRKKVLKAAIEWKDPIRWVPHRRGDGLEFYREACQKGWEGLIAKRYGSAYKGTRSSDWLKFKCVKQQEFVIGGFTDPQGERVGFGALLLGYYRQGKLTFAGRVGTGFDDRTLKDLRKQMDGLQRKTSPFDQGEPGGDGLHFITPNLVCEVGFAEWTDDGKLRHPRFKGMRRDKDPDDVHREEISQRANLGPEEG